MVQAIPLGSQLWRAALRSSGSTQGPAPPMGAEKGLKGREAPGLADTQNSGCLSACWGPSSVVITATVYQAPSQRLRATWLHAHGDWSYNY